MRVTACSAGMSKYIHHMKKTVRIPPTTTGASSEKAVVPSRATWTATVLASTDSPSTMRVNRP